jgi:hypothetical protein
MEESGNSTSSLIDLFYVGKPLLASMSQRREEVDYNVLWGLTI